MDQALSEDLGAFTSLARSVLALSGAIGSAMIGSGCTGFDEAVERVRQWDSAFVDALRLALENEDIPDIEPTIPKIKRLKKDSDTDWQAKLDDRAQRLHARCALPLCTTVGNHAQARSAAAIGRGLRTSQTPEEHGGIL